MYLITIFLLGYIAFGWLSLIRLEKKPFLDVLFNNLLTVGILAGILFISHWLEVDTHTLILLSIALGATTFRAKNELYDGTLLLLFFGTVGYFVYFNGIVATLFLIVLSVVLSFIVQIPLVEMPKVNNKVTLSGSLKIAYVLGIVSYLNILILFFLYGI